MREKVKHGLQEKEIKKTEGRKPAPPENHVTF